MDLIWDTQLAYLQISSSVFLIGVPKSTDHGFQKMFYSYSYNACFHISLSPMLQTLSSWSNLPPLWDKLTILFYTPGMIFHFFKSHFAKAKIIKLNYLQEPWEIIVLIRKF